MRDGPLHKAETFHSAARLPWQCDHESLIDDRGEVARENRVGRNLHRFGAHHFSEPWQFYSHHGTNRFRRNITRSDTRAPSRQNQSAALHGKRPNCFLNPCGLVRHNRFRQNVPANLLCDLFQGRPAQVVVITPAGAIRNRDDTNLYLHACKRRRYAPRVLSLWRSWIVATALFVFSSNSTSEMIMCLSTALHMS